ncbi:alpha/beta hydrolase-fold protein [uncultured Microbacterium sp.]|uniref:enterochelin esterase domain-containing protein n=1 Tax=uncultured Microbacterium sp. TaxID=191216 RepID=UPI0026031CDD|nr:alpha/beta hydrolase-fold protein [uncultured Microbacterium sp.]
MTIIDEVRARLVDGDAAALEAFWGGLRTPVIEPVDGSTDEMRATFFWRDATAEAVVITINRITESLDEGRMERIPGTDVWFRSFLLGADWRGSYTVLPLDAQGLSDIGEREPRWAMRIVREQGRLDPRNPVAIRTHGGRASVAEMPGAMPLPWPDRLATVRGAMSEHRLDHGRRVWVHRPAGDDGLTPRPVVILLDGEVWQDSADAASAVDALAEADGLHAPYLVMVDAEGPRRMTDLSIDGGMSEEIVTRILPWVRDLLPISTDPADVIVSGESLGGLTALKTAFDHPGIVGSAIAQSSSLWQHDMLERAASAAPVRLFLTAGSHEDRLVGENRALVAQLEGSAHEHHYIEYNGGHDMAWWRGLWAEGVRHLLQR